MRALNALALLRVSLRDRLASSRHLRSTLAAVPVLLRVVTVCFLHIFTCICMRLKAWLATRVSLRLARPARARRSRRLRAMLAATPVLFAHTLGTYHIEKTNQVSGSMQHGVAACLWLACLSQR